MPVGIGAIPGFKYNMVDAVTPTILDNLNASIRTIVMSPGDINDLASFMLVGNQTCRRWFTPVTRDYKQCIPDVAMGRRLVHLIPNTLMPPTAGKDWATIGKRERQERYAVFYRMAFCAMAGTTTTLLETGLTKESEFHGAVKSTVYYAGTLSKCMRIFKAVYDYKVSAYLAAGWVKAVIFRPPSLVPDDGFPAGWRLRFDYQVHTKDDVSPGLSPIELPADDGGEWTVEKPQQNQSGGKSDPIKPKEQGT